MDRPISRRTGKTIAGKKRPPPRPARKRRKPGIAVNIAVVAVTLCIVAACVFWIAGFRFYKVTSNSMAPTLEGGGEKNYDLVLCWMLSPRYREPRRWEVVIFNTPESSKSQTYVQGIGTPEEIGVTIKRVVGLPGEHLSLAGGDVWVRNADGADVRQIKPDPVQRDLWIDVYNESFSDATLDEFLLFWHAEKREGLAVTPEHTLTMDAGSGIAYRPLSRNVGDVVAELPGIPDRYVLPQHVMFRCAAPACATDYEAFVSSQKIQGRCPACGRLNLEGAIVFYGYRSGLPEIGPYSAGDFRQKDDSHRSNSYYFVPDLRVRLEFRPDAADAVCEIRLVREDGEDTLLAGPGGISVNGVPADAASRPEAGKWTGIEFCRVDGVLRVFLNGSDDAVQEIPVVGNKPDPNTHPKTSGVAVAARAGRLALRNIDIQRDVYYFSGHEQGMLNFLASMGKTAEIAIPHGAFFPLGDNTTVSLDGRSWGAVDIPLIRGSAVGIWKPESRRRRIH